jgi:hypothetical protein
MLFALALFGCADDGSACQRLAAPEQAFESRMECMAAQSGALDSDAAAAADFPSVFAQCMTRSQLASLGHGTMDLRKTNVALASAD